MACIDYGREAVEAEKRGDTDRADEMLGLVVTMAGQVSGECSIVAETLGNIQRADHLVAGSDNTGYWSGECAVAAAGRGNTKRADALIALSVLPGHWIGQCARVARALAAAERCGEQREGGS